MVGSSKSSRSGAENSTAASATRIRQPPEKAEQGIACSSSVNPSPLRIDEARASADQASISASRVWISAILPASVAVMDSSSNSARSVSAFNTVSRSDTSLPGTSWSTPPMRARLGRVISPPSSASSPRISRKSVVLPVPLRPTMPTLCPSGITAEACSIRGRPATE